MLTFWSCTTSSIGQRSWFLCFFDVWQTKQTGCLSFRQKSFSFSWCRLQNSDESETFWFLFLRKTSHKFFSTRLHGGSDLEDLLLQTGQSWNALVVQNFTRQFLHKLWLQDNKTGSLKISQHTGQERSSSEKIGLEAILLFKFLLPLLNAIKKHKQIATLLNKNLPCRPQRIKMCARQGSKITFAFFFSDKNRFCFPQRTFFIGQVASWPHVTSVPFNRFTQCCVPLLWEHLVWRISEALIHLT